MYLNYEPPTSSDCTGDASESVKVQDQCPIFNPSSEISDPYVRLQKLSLALNPLITRGVAHACQRVRPACEQKGHEGVMKQ